MLSATESQTDRQAAEQLADKAVESTAKSSETATESPAVTIMFTGGGTGGHIYPGLAVANALQDVLRNANIIWVGTPDRLEARLVPQAGYPIEFIRVSFLKGRGLWGKVRALLRIPRAFWDSRRLLRQHRPALVVGVGGYAAGPVTLMAALRRTPTAILEQNARPGLTNRILSRFVKRIFASFEESRAWFSKKKVRVTGNPVRADLFEPRDVEPRGVDDPVRVLVFGGSQGAKSLNLDLPSVLVAVAEAGAQIDVRHASGTGRKEEVREAYGDASFVEITEYIDDMGSAYAWADFVVCRAGASTVAELTAVGKPALYVPFGAASDNHQERNARAVVANGGGLIASDIELTEPAIVDRLVAVLSDNDEMEEMGRRAGEMGRPDAARSIADELATLVRRA